MAEDNKPKRRPVIKKTETLRQRAVRVTADAGKPKKRRIHATATRASQPFRRLHRIGKKTIHLPMPNNRFGRVMNKRVTFFPSFFKKAWGELRQVEWPSNKTTARLTFAVFMFSLVFGALIAIVDFGLDKIFRKVFLQ